MHTKRGAHLCVLSIFLLVAVDCADRAPSRSIDEITVVPAEETILYHVDLTDRSDDLFRVELTFTPTTARSETILQFPVSAPGTYQTMDIGRYVRDIDAFDADGSAHGLTRLNTNKWQLAPAANALRIQYTIAETWDTKVAENTIFPMAGTSLEDDHAMICPHAVFGFPLDQQDHPIEVDFELPSGWIAGSALDREGDRFRADDYDQFVDSPLLIGELDAVHETIEGCRFSVYVYSRSGEKRAAVVLEMLRPIIEATSRFLGGFPNDHYTFLFHFEAVTMGAWEHSYSSNYVLGDSVADAFMRRQLPHMAAHELFHMITPLHIHSELIEDFDFARPGASKHLWFYEGVTEWAANMMMVRANVIDLEHYLGLLRSKRMTSAFFDNSISLVDIGTLSFTDKGSAVFPNIYMKGALAASALDLLILKETNGERGLRELILELARDFGPNRAFPEDGFMAEIESRTSPAVGDFLRTYVVGAEPLPLNEVFAWVGIDYDSKKGTFKVMDVLTPAQQAFRDRWSTNLPLPNGNHESRKSAMMGE